MREDTSNLPMQLKGWMPNSWLYIDECGMSLSVRSSRHVQTIYPLFTSRHICHRLSNRSELYCDGYHNTSKEVASEFAQNIAAFSHIFWQECNRSMPFFKAAFLTN